MHMYRLVIVSLLLYALIVSGPAMRWQCSGASQPKPWKSPILTVEKPPALFNEEWGSFREAIFLVHVFKNVEYVSANVLNIAEAGTHTHIYIYIYMYMLMYMYMYMYNV